MLGFLARRVVSGIVLIFVVSALLFALMSATGSNPARNIVGETATQQQVDAKSRELGLDRTVQVLAVAGFAVPSFLVALLLALFVAVKWGLLPATGYMKFADSPTGW